MSVALGEAGSLLARLIHRATMNRINQMAYRFAVQVGAAGKLKVTVPVPAGTPVEVVVLAPSSDEFADLVDAAQTSLDFWDNPQNDADWNHA